MRCQLDHERLDVYQVELEFVAWSTDLMVELLESPEAKIRRVSETSDYLDRACLSALFNTAEGNGRRQMKPQDQVREEHLQYGIEEGRERPKAEGHRPAEQHFGYALEQRGYPVTRRKDVSGGSGSVPTAFLRRAIAHNPSFVDNVTDNARDKARDKDLTHLHHMSRRNDLMSVFNGF